MGARLVLGIHHNEAQGQSCISKSKHGLEIEVHNEVHVKVKKYRPGLSDCRKSGTDPFKTNYILQTTNWCLA